MMRKLLAPFACLAFLVATAVFAGTTPPDKATIDDCVAKKAAVEFPHKAHVDGGIACATCHHNQPDLKAGGEAQTCGSCHTAPEKAETPKCSEMSTTKNPFHLTCVKCHKEELAKKADTKAPTKCDQCHPKA